MNEAAECEEWVTLIKELEESRALIAPLRNFTIPELTLPRIEDAIVQSWYSTTH